MSEIVNSSFEYRPLTPQEQELRDALLYPPLNEQHIRVFEEEIELVAQQQPTQADREMVEAAGRLLHWELFARPGEPLPEGLVLQYSTISGETRVGYPPSSPYAQIWYSNLKPYLAKKAPSINAYRSMYTARFESQRISAAIEDVIRTEERYKFFQSFAVAPPQPTEQPLSQKQRLMQSVSEEDRILQKYRIAREDLPYLIKRTAPHRDMQLINPRLDITTAPRQSQEIPQAFDRFNAWLIDALRGADPALTNHEGYPKLVAITTEQGNIMGETSDQEKFVITSWMVEIVVKQLIPDRTRVPLELPVLGRELASKFVYALYASNDKDLTKALERAVEKEAERAWAHDINHAEDGIDEQILVGLRRPIGSLYDATPRTPLGHIYTIRDAAPKIDMIAPEEEQRLSKIPVGQVVYRSSTTLRDPHSRLIMEQRSTKVYPETPSKYSLIIEFIGSQYSENSEPYIPGFQAVAHTGSKWYFDVAEHDPYQGSDQVMISKYNVWSLANTCQMIGLTSLQQLLQRHNGELSVTDLAEYVRMSTQRPKQRMVSIASENITLREFAPYIHNGLLIAQCTGSGAFMNAILKQYLPREGASAAPIRGLELPTYSRTISKYGHEQTLYTYKGKQYIVDASRPEELRVGWTQRIVHAGATAMRNYQMVQQEKHNPIATEAPSQAPIEEPQPISAAALQEYHASSVTKIRAELEVTLQNIFQAAPGNGLYEQLSKLSPQDPNREAMRLLYQMEQGDATGVDEALTYLREYANADEMMHRTLRTSYSLPTYGAEHLEYLMDALTAAKRFMPSTTQR